MGNGIGWLIFFAADTAVALIVMRMLGKPMPFAWLIERIRVIFVTCRK